jgi:hypothetical protein
MFAKCWGRSSLALMLFAVGASCSGGPSSPTIDPASLIGDWDDVVIISDSTGSHLCVATAWRMSLQPGYATADSFFQPTFPQPGDPDSGECRATLAASFEGRWTPVSSDSVVRYFEERGSVRRYEERARVRLHGDTLEYGLVTLVRRREAERGF